MKVMMTVVYMKVVNENTNKIAVKDVIGPLRTSQTETGNRKD